MGTRETGGIVVNYTPGPWEVRDEVYVVKGSKVIAAASYEGSDNARLIAAAPDLLAALERLAVMDEVAPHICGNIARAAISKATGETT
jgi:hypothetical protein